MLRLLLISLIFLGGCATEYTVVHGECYNKSLPVLLDSTDLKDLFQGMAAELCCGVDYPCRSCSAGVAPACPPAEPAGTPVLVTDFVDLQSYLPNQSGLLLGELMRAGLNRVCTHQVVEAEFAKYFTLSEKGLMVLTRDAGEIMNQEYAQREAVVGTYSYFNKNKVMLFVRRINTSTGKVARMVSRELDYACAGRSVVYTVH